jgi:hypothetical protein
MLNYFHHFRSHRIFESSLQATSNTNPSHEAERGSYTLFLFFRGLVYRNQIHGVRTLLFTQDTNRGEKQTLPTSHDVKPFSRRSSTAALATSVYILIYLPYLLLFYLAFIYIPHDQTHSSTRPNQGKDIPRSRDRGSSKRSPLSYLFPNLGLAFTSIFRFIFSGGTDVQLTHVASGRSPKLLCITPRCLFSSSSVFRCLFLPRISSYGGKGYGEGRKSHNIGYIGLDGRTAVLSHTGIVHQGDRGIFCLSICFLSFRLCRRCCLPGCLDTLIRRSDGGGSKRGTRL